MPRAITLVVLGLLWLAPATAALAQGTPEPLGEVLHDYAGLLTEETASAIESIGAEVWEAEAIPLIVVILPAMAAFPDLPQEDLVPFSTQWMLDWELEDDSVREQSAWCFVSVGDRSARLVLGPAYTDTTRLELQMLLVEHLVPQLKHDAWDEGILATVSALADLARRGLPDAPDPDSTVAGE